MIFIVIAAFAIIAIIAIIAVVRHNKAKEEKQKYYIAAGNIYKEDYLNYTLQNPVDGNKHYKKPKDQKMMLYIKSLNTKEPYQYVFDPSKKIVCGRDQENSNLFINEASVSKNHCCIFSEGFDVYLMDLSSSNGTNVHKGLFRNYLISDGNMIQLETGDIITIGSNKFKIFLFYYDVTIM